MISIDLKQKVLSNSASEGLIKGLRQLPFYLAIASSLIQQGEDLPQAVSLVFLYIFSIPKFFTLILEIGGGLVSNKLGEIGAFKTLPIGSIFRSSSLLVISITFFLNNSYLLIISSISVIIDEIGRCLTSGSFEDAYKRSIKEENVSLNYIAEIDTLSSDVSRGVQFISMLIGLSALGTYLINHNQYSLSVVFFIAFIFSIFPIFANLRWLKEALGYRKENDIENTLNIKDQFLFFVKSRGFLFSLISGGMMYIFIKMASLGPLISNDFLKNVQNESLHWEAIFYTMGIGAIIPIFSILSTKFIVKRRSSHIFFNNLNFYKGATLISIWLLFSVIIYFYFPLSFNINLIFVMLSTFTFMPLLLWSNWMRLEITNGAIEAGLAIGENHSLYYSLISGAKETTLGILSLLFYITVDSHISLYFFSVISATIVFFIFIWAYFETNKKTENENIV